MPPSLFENLFLEHSIQKAKKNPRIAVFRALFLGDLLCFIPAIRSIKESVPSSHICLIGLPWAQEFVKRYHRYFDDFIAFPGFPGLPEQQFDTFKFNTFLSIVSKKKFDIFLQMHGNGEISNKLFSLLSIPYTAGYTSESIKTSISQYNHLFLYPRDKNEIDVWIAFAKKLGVLVKNSSLEFPILREDKKEFKELQKRYPVRKNKYVCIHAGAKDNKRRWSPKEFASVGDLLYQHGFQVVLTGTTSEIGLVRAIASLMQYPSISLGGKTSLGSLAVLLSNSYVVITNDTGVSHVAEAINAKHVVIYNIPESARWCNTESKSGIFVDSKEITSSYQVFKLAQQIH